MTLISIIVLFLINYSLSATWGLSKLYVIDLCGRERQRFIDCFTKGSFNQINRRLDMYSFLNYLFSKQHSYIFKLYKKDEAYYDCPDSKELTILFCYHPRLEKQMLYESRVYSCLSLVCSEPNMDSYLILKKENNFFMWNQSKNKLASENCIDGEEIELNNKSDKINFSWHLLLEGGLIEIYSISKKKYFFYEVEFPLSWHEYSLSGEYIEHLGSYNMHTQKILNYDGIEIFE